MTPRILRLVRSRLIRLLTLALLTTLASGNSHAADSRFILSRPAGLTSYSATALDYGRGKVTTAEFPDGFLPALPRTARCHPCQSATSWSALNAPAGAEAPRPEFVEGLTRSEGDQIITMLQDLQAQLRNGQTKSFQLRSGGAIGLRMTRIPPREAFLELPFENTFSVSKAESDSTDPLHRYTLFVMHRVHSLFCSVLVNIRKSDEQVHAVSIDCGPPPPF